MSSNDEMLRDHQRTWHGFVRLFFAGAFAVATLLAVLALAFYG